MDKEDVVYTQTHTPEMDYYYAIKRHGNNLNVYQQRNG